MAYSVLSLKSIGEDLELLIIIGAHLNKVGSFFKIFDNESWRPERLLACGLNTEYEG